MSITMDIKMKNNLYNYVMINDQIRFDCKYIIKDLINSEKY